MTSQSTTIDQNGSRVKPENSSKQISANQDVSLERIGPIPYF